jgi:hypothetical protein
VLGAGVTAPLHNSDPGGRPRPTIGTHVGQRRAVA